jgi:hypothetical protein
MSQFDDTAATTAPTTTSPVVEDGLVPGQVATQFEVEMASATLDANFTEAENTVDANKLKRALLAANNVLISDNSVFPGITCSSGVCTVHTVGAILGNVTEIIKSIGGQISKTPLPVVGFEGALVLPDDTEKQATIEFASLNIQTTDLGALSMGLERALGGEVVSVGVVGKFKYNGGAGIVVVEIYFATAAEAQEVIEAEEQIRQFVISVYRQLVQTSGLNDDDSNDPSASSTSGNSAEKARALAALKEAGFEDLDSVIIHCTDGVCIYTTLVPPTASQFATLSNSSSVTTVTEMTLKFPLDAQRSWFAAVVWNPTAEMIAAMVDANLAVQMERCTLKSSCPVLFTSSPTEIELAKLQSITGNQTRLMVKEYTRETGCFEPNLQGGPSNDEGRGLLHLAGLSTLDMECHPGTVCCFVTAFPDKLNPLLALDQVTAVSRTVWGTLPPQVRTLVQVMSPVFAVNADQQELIGFALEKIIGTERNINIDCDTVGQRRCAITFDAEQGTTVRNRRNSVSLGTDVFDNDKLEKFKAQLAKLFELVVYQPIATMGTKGSVSFTPPSVQNDPVVIRYLLVENNIEATDVVCAPGGCQYTVSTMAKVTSKVQPTKAAANRMVGTLALSVLPSAAFPQKGALKIEAENAPITSNDAKKILSGVGVIASDVTCSETGCVFDAELFTSEHSSALRDVSEIAGVIFPVVNIGQAGGAPYAGTFKTRGSLALTKDEAMVILLDAGIVPSVLECNKGVCEFVTTQNVGADGIAIMFEALRSNPGVAGKITGPVLMDQEYKMEKAILDAIVTESGARVDQVRILSFDPETGIVNFELIPPCGDADENSVLVSDGCLSEGDNFAYIATFADEAWKLDSRLQKSGVEPFAVHLDGTTVHFTVGTNLTESQRLSLASDGIVIISETRVPVLTVAEIQKVLVDKAVGGELNLPLTSSQINITGSNRTADASTALDSTMLAGAAGGAVVLIGLALLWWCCCKDKEEDVMKPSKTNSMVQKGKKRTGSITKPPVAFSNPMYDTGHHDGQQAGFIGIGSGPAYSDAGYGGYAWEEPEYGEEEPEEYDDTPVSHSTRKCMYEGARGHCRRMSLTTGYYCINHTCEKAGCNNCKESSADKRCEDHQKRPNPNRASIKGRSSSSAKPAITAAPPSKKKSSKKQKTTKPETVDLAAEEARVTSFNGFDDNDEDMGAATYADVGGNGFDDSGNATYADIGGNGYDGGSGASYADIGENLDGDDNTGYADVSGTGVINDEYLEVASPSDEEDGNFGENPDPGTGEVAAPKITDGYMDVDAEVGGEDLSDTEDESEESEEDDDNHY